MFVKLFLLGIAIVTVCYALKVIFQCQHEYEHKATIPDRRYLSSPMFCKEFVFRCKKCGKHHSLYSFDLECEIESYCRCDTEPAPCDFELAWNNTLWRSREAYALYKKYKKRGFDLTKIK